MIRRLGALLAASALFGALAVRGRGEEPAGSAQIRSICSPNRRYCAVLNPSRGTTTVYEVVEGRRVKRWRMSGSFRSTVLCDDGRHLVAGYDGGGVLADRAGKDEVMLRFYDKGRLLRSVRLRELLKNPADLPGRRWGDVLGIDETGAYVVTTVEGRRLAFDVSSGKLSSAAPASFAR
jgi:hypothetical protein